MIFRCLPDKGFQFALNQQVGSHRLSRHEQHALFPRAYGSIESHTTRVPRSPLPPPHTCTMVFPKYFRPLSCPSKKKITLHIRNTLTKCGGSPLRFGPPPDLLNVTDPLIEAEKQYMNKTKQISTCSSENSQRIKDSVGQQQCSISNILKNIFGKQYVESGSFIYLFIHLFLPFYSAHLFPKLLM